MGSEHECRSSETVTHDIRVCVEPSFAPDYSDPAWERYVFAYKIRITNESERPVRLLSRHWLIVDGDGRREEVSGDGVVGKQPDIDPGQTYEYRSFCPLGTRWGTMEGTFTMRADDDTFKASIARFYLVSPAQEVAPTV